jgi:hypothetical protein
VAQSPFTPSINNMKPSDPATHDDARRPLTAVVTGHAVALAIVVAIFVAAANAPYVWLIQNFGYDDILRESTVTILRRFHLGGDALVLAWLAFAASALLFIPVVLVFRRLLREHGIDDDGASVLGVASAVAQATGLLRWVFVVPALAATYVAPDSSDATRQAVIVTFDSVHRLGGMVIGEAVGQLLLAGWTALMVRHLVRARLVPSWLSIVGAIIPLLWLIGQTELLHEVVHAVPSLELTPIAFMAWEAWLVAVASFILFHALQARRVAPHTVEVRG